MKTLLHSTVALFATLAVGTMVAMGAAGCPGNGCTSDQCTQQSSDAQGGDSDSLSPANDSSAEGWMPDGGPTVDGPAPVDAHIAADSPQSSCPPATISGKTVDWTGIYGHAWPGPTYVNVQNVAIPNGGYLAIRFKTGAVVDNGSVYTIENTTVSGIRFGSINACPGEIHGNLPKGCTHVWGIGGSIHWSTESPPNAQHCALQPNKTYYFNLSFVDSSGGDTCIQLYGSQCTTTVSASNPR